MESPSGCTSSHSNYEGTLEVIGNGSRQSPLNGWVFRTALGAFFSAIAKGHALLSTRCPPEGVQGRRSC